MLLYLADYEIFIFYLTISKRNLNTVCLIVLEIYKVGQGTTVISTLYSLDVQAYQKRMLTTVPVLELDLLQV